ADNKKIFSDLKSAESFYQMNSALEILKKVSDHLPSKSQAKVDIKKFEVDDQTVIVEGYVSSTIEKDVTRELLKTLSIDGKVQTLNSSLPSIKNRFTFNFAFNVDRNITKDK
ncbi:MAG: pilus assembly protein PilM, partial [Bdellovibrionales bacterium]|nr:pilus assembly protein PilM [Bdellovibrionales bacterium]